MQKVETQWGIFNAWWRQFVGRFTTSLIEVSLLGTILYGLFFILEVFLLDGGVVTWKYPSAVVSAAHILPGLLVFVLFTPVRAAQRVKCGRRRRRRELTWLVCGRWFPCVRRTRRWGCANCSVWPRASGNG